MSNWVIAQYMIDVAVIVLLVDAFFQRRELRRLESQWQEHKKVRERLYQELTDPEKLDADFEKSARAREMRDAQRSTLPRKDAWPPAVVHRPKMRGAKPGNFRLQRGK